MLYMIQAIKVWRLQITQGDANLEVIAFMKLLVKAYDQAEVCWQDECKAQALRKHGKFKSTSNDRPDQVGAQLHIGCTLRLCRKRSTSDRLEQELWLVRPAFAGFDHHLRDFFKTNWPQEPLPDGPIQVRVVSTTGHMSLLTQKLWGR
jgi:hypothetical protein